jgi:hypothetical protein
MARVGKIHMGRPLRIKGRKELLETVRPSHRRFLRADTGDVPPMPEKEQELEEPVLLQIRRT